MKEQKKEKTSSISLMNKTNATVIIADEQKKPSELTDIKNRIESSGVDSQLPEHKDGRGRKPGQKNKPKVNETDMLVVESSITTMKASVRLLLKYLDKRLPTQIDSTDSEIDLIAGSLENVLNKYKPMLISFAPELTLATTVIIYMLPRIRKPENKNGTSSGNDNGDGRQREKSSDEISLTVL